ncbi:hypothetical protein AURDEDRAFT_165782 [Auricularia subglabra TFB-10046 SS5]|nr:hypothetical protein AURDEDRAFT_165782 [Auricularia subglabra TFB-10046 SS5]
MLPSPVSSAFSSFDEACSAVPTQEEIVIRNKGPWSYERFGRAILCLADNQGDDAALAKLRNSFPRLDMENARLWLAYLKSSRKAPFDACIMNSFRTMSYFHALRNNTARHLFPELARLLPGLQKDTTGEEVASGPGTSRPGNPNPQGSSPLVNRSVKSGRRRGGILNAFLGPITIQNVTINQHI